MNDEEYYARVFRDLEASKELPLAERVSALSDIIGMMLREQLKESNDCLASVGMSINVQNDTAQGEK